MKRALGGAAPDAGEPTLLLQREPRVRGDSAAAPRLDHFSLDARSAALAGQDEGQLGGAHAHFAGYGGLGAAFCARSHHLDQHRPGHHVDPRLPNADEACNNFRCAPVQRVGSEPMGQKHSRRIRGPRDEEEYIAWRLSGLQDGRSLTEFSKEVGHLPIHAAPCFAVPMW